MSLLVVGSVAYDSLKTPFGEAPHILGGSAMYFSASSSFLCKPEIVAVVGEDFDMSELEFLVDRGVSLGGLEVVPGGKTFHWSGHYGYDLNEAQTLATELNVFEHFQPRLTPEQRDSDVVFLANIIPSLQLSVLDQVKNPKFIAVDSMNLWIDSQRDDLMEVLGRVNMAVINESEARQLAGESNTVKAALAIREMGPEIVVVKRGEYGALMNTNGHFFYAPAFPLESVFDPTGAGDTFAGGLVGTVAQAGNTDEDVLRRGVVLGSVLASFVVETFGVQRMRSLTWDAVMQRYDHMRQLTNFGEFDKAMIKEVESY